MLSTLDQEEVTNELHTIRPIILVIALIEIAINFIVLICWFISKYTLFHIIEAEKYYKKWKIHKEDLTIINKFGLMLITIFSKSEIIGFIWNIIFASLGCSHPKNTFLFSIQLLIIINLSNTMKNIIKSITLKYKQLLKTAMLLIILCYVFANIAFYFISEDFIITIGGSHHRLLNSAASTDHGTSHSPSTAGV